MSKQISAVEWFRDQLEFDESVSIDNIEDLLEQAKEIEKQQIIDSFNKGFITDQWDKSKENKAEQYYNEKFKSK